MATSELVYMLPDLEEAARQDTKQTVDAGHPLRGTVSPFGETLAERVAERESQVVLGLDPNPTSLWPLSDELVGVRAASKSVAESAAAAVVNHCRLVIDAVASACVAVKLQMACFERMGAPGWEALSAVAEYAHERRLLVIADGKRGDIEVTARAYSEALFDGLDTPFGKIPGLGADLVCVNPLMGRDAVAPFIEAARACGAGVLVLVRTSNPSAADVEDLELAGGGTVWESLAALVDELGQTGAVTTGLSDVGGVVGATVPQHVERARELMPRAIFLLPGVGAQGGRVEDLAPAFAPGRAGGLITASRAIVEAYRVTGGDPAQAARAEAERLRDVAWSLQP